MLLLGSKLCEREHRLDTGNAERSQFHIQLFLLPVDGHAGIHSTVSDDVHAYGGAEEEGFGWRIVEM